MAHGVVAHFSPPWQHGFDTCFSTEAKVPTWDPMIKPSSAKNGRWWHPAAEGEGTVHYNTHYWDERGQQIDDNLDGDDSQVIIDRVIPFVRASKQQHSVLRRDLVPLTASSRCRWSRIHHQVQTTRPLRSELLWLCYSIGRPGWASASRTDAARRVRQHLGLVVFRQRPGRRGQQGARQRGIVSRSQTRFIRGRCSSPRIPCVAKTHSGRPSRKHGSGDERYLSIRPRYLKRGNAKRSALRRGEPRSTDGRPTNGTPTGDRFQFGKPTGLDRRSI